MNSLRHFACVATVALGLVSAVTLSGCKTGCIGGEAQCRVEPPCKKVTFQCDDNASAALSIEKISSASARPKGLNALGTVNDYMLKNAYTKVLIAGLGDQNYLDPNGGSILDLTTTDGADGINNILTVTGVLPSDAPRFTQVDIIDERPNRVAIQFRGTMDGRPDLPIYVRYEMQPCDPGLRIRSELVNTSPDNQMWAMSDGYYWSKREPVPFTAGKGQGFNHIPFGILTANEAFQSFPFLAFSLLNGEIASYASVSCNGENLTGFNSDSVSIAGLKKQVVPPRGWISFERFLGVADSRDVQGGIKIALDVRKQLLKEQYIQLTGKLERPTTAVSFGPEGGSVMIEEGQMSDPPAQRTPWTQVLPDKDGKFTATVPAGKSYVVSISAFGKTQIEKPFQNLSQDTDLGTFTLPSFGTLRFEVTDSVGGNLDAEIFLVPFVASERAAFAGSFHGQHVTCSPWLGAPPGPSPACNRVLVRNGVATADIPAGKFHMYAFHGPFWSLGHQEVSVVPSQQTVKFQLTKLMLQPTATLSADLHVHGGASFDSMIPDYDRVLSFSASEIDVIVATDHDVVYDYSQIVNQLGLQSKITTVTGVETTAHIPWMRVPNHPYPQVIGHYIFWPIPYDPSKPRNGGPFEELIEPGILFTRANDLMKTPHGVFQLNHPWAAPEAGRDLGFPRALKLDLRKDLPTSDDGKDGAGMYVRTPSGASFANDAHHAQEVMNGSQNDLLVQYRYFWFYLLNQGRLRAGTANSDSHSLTDSTVGMPRTLVYADTQVGPAFDLTRFNQAIKGGRILGTSGPIIEATLATSTGEQRSFGLDLMRPATDAKLKIKVTTAPWAPVPELRIVVNGQVVKTLNKLPLPGDPFATSAHLVFDGEVPLAELVAGISGDAWIVVEASRPLPVADDLGGGINNAKDGMPDTTDNNGDGKIDKADVAKGEDFGPLANFAFPADSDPFFPYSVITDNGFPYAFTNPFVLDLNGNGKFDAPGVKGGR